MRVKYTSGPPVAGHNGQEAIALPADAGKRTTHYTIEGPGVPTSAKYKETDQHGFADSSLLVGERLLRVGLKYSNQQISEQITVHKGAALGRSGVARRIRAALVARATSQGTTASEASVAFVQARKANGIQTRAQKVDASGDKAAGEVSDSEHSELTEFETDVEA